MAVDLDDTALVRWRASPIAFIEEMLHDPETGRPFVLLEAERAFMRHAFTLDRNGRLAYPELVYGAIKKSGKTTCAALIVAVRQGFGLEKFSLIHFIVVRQNIGLAREKKASRPNHTSLF